MDNKTVLSFTVTIYVGFKELDTGVMHTVTEARQICQDYCDEVGLCVTVTPTAYIYTDGNEPGVAIGLINYPRFPARPRKIRRRALELARRLLLAFNQYRVSIVFPFRTVMLNSNLAGK